MRTLTILVLLCGFSVQAATERLWVRNPTSSTTNYHSVSESEWPKVKGELWWPMPTTSLATSWNGATLTPGQYNATYPTTSWCQGDLQAGWYAKIFIQYTNGGSWTLWTNHTFSYDGELVVINLAVIPTAPPETNCLYQFPLQNNTTAVQTYYAARDLQIDPAKTLVLGPGQSGILQFNALCADSALWRVMWGPYGEPEVIDYEPQVTPVTESPTNRAPYVVDEDGPTTYNPTNGTNIEFSDGTNSTETGFNALYDAITKFAAQNDRNLQRILSNSTSSSVVVSNYSNFSTNVSDQGTHDRLDAIHNSMTNQSGIADLRTSLTNLWGTPETSEQTDFNIMMEIENDVDATVPTGNASFWEVALLPASITTTKFNFLPSGQGLAGVFAIAKKWLTWILLITYGIFVMKDIFELLKLAATTAQMDAPEAEATIFGIGGNWGMALAPVVLGVFLAAWALLLVQVTGSFASVFGGTDWLATIMAGPISGTSGSTAEGMAEAGKFIPLATIISLAVAYLVWTGTKNIVAAKVTFLIRVVVH